MADADLQGDPRQPWGYLATQAWAFMPVALCEPTIVAESLTWTAWQVGSPSLELLDEFLDEPFWVGLAVAIASAVLVAVVALAAWLRGWSARDYLGLRWP